MKRSNDEESWCVVVVLFFYALEASIMILLWRVYATLTYLFVSRFDSPFHLSYRKLRGKREAFPMDIPLTREGLEMIHGNTYGRFWREHKDHGMHGMEWVITF
ncbi:hypothetical protein NW765_006082 [Fusarium oxysporum]|jgi:hypothetical protein|nr:hypothetical protein NW765_006082 [Fusarium oxysporum]